MRTRINAYLIPLLLACSRLPAGVSSLAVATTVRGGGVNGATATPPSAMFSNVQESIPTKDVVTNVAVAGATGRTGRYVVEELLNRGVSNVVAIVRDMDKANEVFGTNPPSNLQIVKCDLTNENEIRRVLTAPGNDNSAGVDAAIWCATGFSDNEEVSPIEKIKRLFGIALTPKRTIDAIGPATMGAILSQKQQQANGSTPTSSLPKVVMLSSAGVTRPSWSDEKKERFKGAADIPIVRLNPFGILDVKRESEDVLRRSGVDYCIVRPAGLNDKWPAGSRPIISQGDVAAGRINRKDVASVLVDVLSAPEATGKTFEVVALAGYPKGVSIRPALANLVRDDDARYPGPESIDNLASTYAAMQQLLPGEKQDAAGLAMGQTYEQLDKGETGRLGKRGQENAEAAAPKPSSSSSI